EGAGHDAGTGRSGAAAGRGISGGRVRRRERRDPAGLGPGIRSRKSEIRSGNRRPFLISDFRLLISDYRPSRSHIAPTLLHSSRRPSTPANTGSTPMPRTTLASRIFSPIQSSPLNVSDERTGSTRGTVTPDDASATRRASPPVAAASGASTSV